MLAPEKREPWTLEQWVTFFFFYTVPGLVLMAVIGASLWVLVLLPLTYVVRRLHHRRTAQKQEREQERGHGGS